MSGERILIVDEQPKIARRMARALLQSQGAAFQVDVCTSGEQALERMSGAHIHLIVADVRIPGIGGLELLAHVRQRSPMTRCILTTGYSTPALQETAHQLRVNGYLVKPFTMSDFLRAVQDALPPPPPPPTREPQPIPNAAFAEALEHMQGRIAHLVRDVGALGALVLDPSGQLLAETGARSEFDTNAFVALAGSTMAAMNAVAHMLRDDDAFDLHFHEGKNYAIYTARINDAMSLALILPQGSNSRIGLVWLALRRAIADLRQFVADATSSATSQAAPSFMDALDDSLDLSLEPSGGVGPADAPDALEALKANTPMDSVDPLQALLANGTLEPIGQTGPEKDRTIPDQSPESPPFPLFEYPDALDLREPYRPSEPQPPQQEPAAVEAEPVMSTPEEPAAETTIPPSTMPEPIDFDPFNIGEDTGDADVPPAPSSEEPKLLSYEEAKRLGLINF